MGISGSNASIFGTNLAYMFTQPGQDIPIAFFTNGIERLRINKSGNVGIGTIFPMAGLHVDNTVQGESAAQFHNLNITDGSPTVLITNEGVGVGIEVISTESGTAAILARGNGKAIGACITSDSSTALLVSGQFASSDAAILVGHFGDGEVAVFTLSNTNSTKNAVEIDNNGLGHALFVKGTAMRQDANPNWNTTSDRRLKKDIKPFDDGLNVLTQIEPVRFRYNGLCGILGLKERVGVIAQDIREVAPYMIDKRDMRLQPDDPENQEVLKDVLTYDPSALDYIMINAIKELNEKVDGLLEENIKLKTAMVKFMLKSSD